ncbi:MAG: DUF1016 domain-containing protein [Bacteroidetes bacterium]|nr:DUF1016 domain-containing protein [Bacteroidota bacterium]
MAVKRKSLLFLKKEIRQLIEAGRENVYRKINVEILITYWNIGKLIVEFEQQGKSRAEYGRELILELSRSLTKDLGKGFSRSNIQMMRGFYTTFDLHENQIRQTVSGKSQIRQTVSGKSSSAIFKGKVRVSPLLSWSHYGELLQCSNILAIGFYLQLAIRENWSVRDLKRQIDSSLFERIALSKNPKAVLKLAHIGPKYNSAEDIVRDPYVLEFLKIPEDGKYTESHLEKRIIANLQKFILELGKGFAFVGRQYRITIANVHHYVDLVFYHTKLKCYVLIDLKAKAVNHRDVGQMNLYLNYFDIEKNAKTDNPPIGIILSQDKDDINVEYAIRGITNKIFVSKYQLYLPDKKILRAKVREMLDKT